MKKLLNNEGMAYFETLIVFFILAMLLGLFITILPVFSVKNDLDNFANEIVRAAELSGRIGDEVEAEIRDQERLTNLAPDIRWNKTGKVDIGERIEVSIKVSYKAKLFDVGAIEIPLTAKATGRSQVYWKE